MSTPHHRKLNWSITGEKKLALDVLRLHTYWTTGDRVGFFLLVIKSAMLYLKMADPEVLNDQDFIFTLTMHLQTFCVKYNLQSNLKSTRLPD